MGFGAFGGALASSALSTYERLGEEELRDMQRKQMKKDIAEKEALDRAYADSQARVGQQDDYSSAIKTGGGAGTQQSQMLSDQGALRGNTPEDQAFEKASAESAAGAMRENAVRQGAVPADKAALPAMKPSEYSADQGMKDYVKAAGQISRKGALEAVQLKTVMRESDLQDKFDTSRKELDNTLAMIQGTSESGGLKGLYEIGKKNGLNLKMVEGKNGVGSRIQVLGPKGDVLETVSDVAGAVQKLSDAAMQQFMTKSTSLLGSPDKVIAAMQKEKEMVLKGREVDIKGREVDIKEPYYKAAANKENAQASALGNAAEERAAGRAYMEKYNALTPEQKNSPEGKALLDQAEGAMAAKSGDVSRIRANTPEGKASAGYDREITQAGKDGRDPMPREKFYALQGFAPSMAQAAAASGINPETKKPFTEAEIKAYNKRYPNTPFPKASAPKAALPVPQ